MNTSQIIDCLDSLEIVVEQGANGLRRISPEAVTPIEIAVILKEVVATHYAIRDLIREFRGYVISHEVGIQENGFPIMKE